MKKILIEGMSCMMGGLETFILTLYRNMDKEEYHFDFITYDESIPFEEELKSQGSTVFKVTARSKSVLQYKKELDNIFEENGYDIFWSNRTTLSSIQPFRAAKKYNVPVIICHSHQSKNMGSTFTLIMHKLNQKQIRKYITKKAACSDVAAEWFFGNDKDVVVLKNSVDTDAYDYDLEKAEKLKKENNLEGKFVLGHIGRFAVEKNHKFLIEIFEKVLEKEKNAVLLLCGDGEERANIEELVKEKKLEDHVKFLGIRKDIIDILHMFDVLVFPSLFEGLPFVLVEAQAAGLYCVVSDQVSQESKLTDRMEFIGLNQDAEYWAERIMEYKNISRTSSKEQMEASGFTISNLLEQIQELILAEKSDI